MRYLMAAAMLAMLAACGGGTNDKSIATCEQALKDKAQGKKYTINEAELKASAKSNAEGEVTITGEVIFFPGLPREAKQHFACTTRVVEGKSELDVISFSLYW